MKTNLRLRRLRLINFHNFVDETIELDGAGHLFLLGDNGSGKTTVLDAIHYVLSGGQALELNAAARIGGRREDGRSLQGVVLLYDVERGVGHPGGAIAYAVLELEDDGGERWSVGLGAEATTLEARVVKWGLVSRRPLEALPLLASGDGGDAPARREALREVLGRSEVFFQLTEYRAALADRLFGGAATYDEVCRFWSMAKAYREIVAESQDFAALFRRLLPGPDVAVFGEIVRSLRALDEIEVTLRELDEQRGYVAGLAAVAGEIDAQREAATRYGWLAIDRAREDARADHGAIEVQRGVLAEQIAARGEELAAMADRAAAAEEALRAAESADGDGLLAARGRAIERTHERDHEAARSEREAAGLAARAGEERARAAAAAEEERARRRDLAFAFDGALAAAMAVPGDLAGCRALAGALARGETAAPAAAAREAGQLVEAAGRELAARQGAAGAAAEDERRAAAALAALRELAEEIPAVPGFALAVEAARAAGLATHPIYALCEPAAGADPAALAALEAVAGDDVLGALVAPGAEARVAAAVHAVAPAVRVVQRSVDVELPGWAAALLVAPTGAAGEAARRALAAALVQPAALGEVAVPDGDALELGGARFRCSRTAPRLFGAAARRAALAERVAAAESVLGNACAERARSEQLASAAARLLAAAEGLRRAIEAIAGAGLDGLAARAATAAEQASWATELADRAGQRAAEARAAASSAAAVLAALEARIAASGLAALEARLAALRVVIAATRADRDAAAVRLQRVRFEAEGLAARAAELATRIAVLDGELAGAAIALRRRWPAPHAALDDEGLAHHVLVTLRGGSFRSLATIRERLAECARAEAAAIDELERDGSRGIKHISWAARFGFGYDRTENRLLDRRDQPLAGVLAELEQTLAEQREVATERTRELMERLVMGSLARDLQGQVEGLARMIRDINRLLGGIRFGATTYEFRVTPRAERVELVELVRRLSLLDRDSQAGFRAWIEERIDQLRAADVAEVPDVLDYRTWYDYRLIMKTTGAEGVELSHSLRRLGSGGEQGVPNYLLVLALARLLFDRAGARLRPLLFDEAFYGIDAGRRDQLLRFATELGLQLVVASPDQDGATPAVHAATTLFVVKDDRGDVHLAPYHYWSRPAGQPDLFALATTPPDLTTAECRTPS